MSPTKALKLTFCCDAKNDLYKILTAGGGRYERCSSISQAVRGAPKGTGVLVLADDYPKQTVPIEPEMFEQAAARDLRLYVEYPSRLPGLDVGQPRGTRAERAVIASSAFGEALPAMSIAQIHDCHFVPAQATAPHIVTAKVAGFNQAVYGLPEKDVFPILFEMPGANVMVATTKLSQFVTGRYAPQEAWRAIWQMVLEWLCPGARVALDWTPAVRAYFGPGDKLPSDAAGQAVRRGTDWFIKARMLPCPGWEETNDKVGDGSDGAGECFISRIRYDGSQPRGMGLRNDCISESAMALAIRYWLDSSERFKTIAANLQDFIYGPRGFQVRSSADPESPTFGLIKWSTGSQEVFFGDDNARSILGTIATATALGDDHWDEKLLRAILGNFRASGPYALQGHNLWEQLLFKYGWEHYWHHDQARLAPHFESWITACFLWLYDKTHFAPLLERTRRGIERMMQTYPDKWKWTNGIQQERARMLLPLAWLVRVDDTPEHRAWLHRMADDLLACQDACGAIREEVGQPGQGLYGPPKSNEAYATNEAPLIQVNGEKVCDMLYTSNFALLSLTEAAAATGDARLKKAADKLADFLVRIQVRSEARPELDGAWFRGFDFGRWEHWGSNADAGWGVWCTETGWTQGWICTVLALQGKKTNFWDFTAGSKIARHMDKLRPMMLPDRVLASSPPPPRPEGATEDLHLPVYHDDLWTGYVGRDVETTVDIGRDIDIRSLAADFCTGPAVGLILPKRVEFSVSSDGKTFQPAAVIEPDFPVKDRMSAQRVATGELNVRGRYVRMNAYRSDKKSADAGPAQQMPGARPRKIWVFIDEILVNPTT